MLKRSILFLPEIEEDDWIHQLRYQYDPLFSKIGPHVTVVFPFESDLKNDDIITHMKEVLRGITSFKVVFSGITGDWPSGYLFLNVKKGNDQLIAIHDQLYQGILRPYLWWGHYLPHITVGQIGDYDIFQGALEESRKNDQSYKLEVRTIALETIDQDENSTIEYIHYLDGRN
ncbi:2'-5' RNA ligase family protein [uncultured Vagococcus sp.]|uniref:2'-5' RNA ligase family protein n=1 Tax=uncultured Vagococcus sp. TaxID=189676 RepID=UPI0028D41AD4|nr:2'-5' RNA ligase family protein [uncultured Vagococcus sp.]